MCCDLSGSNMHVQCELPDAAAPHKSDTCKASEPPCITRGQSAIPVQVIGSHAATKSTIIVPELWLHISKVPSTIYAYTCTNNSGKRL